MTVIRPLLLCTLIPTSMFIAACGGGGGGDDGGGNVRVPIPTSTAQAVQQQSTAAAALESLVEELIAGDNAANTALDEERYADFDAYWRQDYPDWVDRFSEAADRFAQTEQNLAMRALTEEARSAAASPGEGDPARVTAKVGPLPFVLLAAAATFTGIAIKERERLARLNDGVDEDETQAIIDARATYLRATQGLNQIQAQVRAQVDVAQVEVLRGLKTGIEHARQFATEQATTFFGSYLPETLGEVVDLFDEAGKLDEIRDNATVLLSDPGCDASARSRSATAPAKALEAFPVCRVRFCDASDFQCDNVPEGQWATSIFADGFLRDEVVVDVQSGTFNDADFTLFTPEEADAARDPGNGGGGGDGGGGFNELSSASFTLRLTADGERFIDQSPFFIPESRSVEVSGTLLPPLGPQDCIPLANPPSDFGFGFLSQSPASASTRVFRQVGGLIRATDCAQLPLAAVLAAEDFGSNPVVDVEDLDATFSAVPRLALEGGSSFSSASRIVFGLSGSAVCAALTDFFYASDDGDYFAEAAVCDASSRLEIVFER